MRKAEYWESVTSWLRSRFEESLRRLDAVESEGRQRTSIMTEIERRLTHIAQFDHNQSSDRQSAAEAFLSYLNQLGPEFEADTQKARGRLYRLCY